MFTQTEDVDPILFQCWASAVDDGPTIKQNLVHISALLFPLQTRKMHIKFARSAYVLIQAGPWPEKYFW